MPNSYGSDSIVEFKGADPYRQRPATVLGTDDERGVLHAIWEVVTNATDEGREGYSDKTIITVEEDGTVQVQDFGRGVPMAWSEKAQKYAWELIFCTMYATGKSDASSYKKSAGLNGIGDTAAQFTSEFMQVISIRDEEINGAVKRVKYLLQFKKGYPVGELRTEDTDEHTGTWIRFKPDLEVFRGASSVDIPIEVFLDRMRRDAMLEPKATFVLNYKDKSPITIHFDGGVGEWLDIVTPERITKNFIECSGSMFGQDDPDRGSEPYEATVDVTFGFSRKESVVEIYHNGQHLPAGGAAQDGFKEAIANVVNDYAKNNNKLPKGEKYSIRDIENLIIGVVSSECPGHLTSWEHQTKIAINNKFIKAVTKALVTEGFKQWANNNKDSMDRVLKEIEANRLIRIESENLSKNYLRTLTKRVDNFKDTVEKLDRCTSNNPKECELYIVEGDSAKGPISLARDAKTQAVLPLRGKIINCSSEPIRKVLKSQVVNDVLRCIGCGIEAIVKGVKDIPKFDITKLNYDKIIICTDADDDGYHIVCLVLLMLWTLVPTLIKTGHVYVAKTPLFLIDILSGKEKTTMYAYTVAERDKILAELASAGYRPNNIIVKRLKGLGETNEVIMNETTMDKENRHLMQIVVNNDDEFNVLINSLMGSDVESRRTLLEAYWNEDFDEQFSGEEVVTEEAIEIDLNSISK